MIDNPNKLETVVERVGEGSQSECTYNPAIGGRT